MHELGIVFAMIDQLEDVAKEQHLSLIHIWESTQSICLMSSIGSIAVGRKTRTRW